MINPCRPCICSALILWILAAVWAVTGNSADRQMSDDFRVAGYLPDYRLHSLDLNRTRELTDLILFSAEITGDGDLDMKRLENAPWEKLLTFKTRHRVRLILSIGGWERSAHFAEVASSPEKRKAFADAVIRTALQRRLDGFDLDWEHPKSAEEQDNYGRLLMELREAFAPRGLVLTVTIAGWQRLSPEAVGAVDAVQLMAYDHAGEHSTLEKVRKEVQTLLNVGVPREKLVLGLPFYGRDVETREARSYRDILAKAAPEDITPDIDRLGRMYFNGPTTLRAKTEFAIREKLKGVMVWELGQDATGDDSLLTLILETVGGLVPHGTER